MESHLIDDLSPKPPELRKNNRAVKVIVPILCVVGFATGILCIAHIREWMDWYCYFFRHKIIVWFDLHKIFAAIAISTIPLTAYLAWRRRFGKEGIKSYLVLLTITVFLFIVMIIPGIEIIFSFSVARIDSPNALYPPIPRVCFNLLFILDALFLFLLFQMLSRKAKTRK